MMRNLFRRIWITWDDLDGDDKLGFVMWAVVILALVTVVTAIGSATIRLDDPKPPGKTIYLQPY